MLHAHRLLESGPRAAHRRTAPARIPATKGAARDITAHSCANIRLERVRVRELSYGMKQSINQSINQQERNNNSWHPAAGANQFEAIQSAESNTISIELVPHAHRRLNPHLAPPHDAPRRLASRPRKGIHGAFMRDIQHE